MSSNRFTVIRRVFGWLAFSLLLSAPAVILASPDHGNSFVVRNARVFDGHRVLEQSDVWVEGGKIKAVGKNLKVSSDSVAGGKSTGEMKIVDGSAQWKQESSGCLWRAIDAGLPYAWSGVMFSPGSQPFVPVNLSSKKSVSFFAKGDGQTYRVLVFTASGGRIPTQQTFMEKAERPVLRFPRNRRA
jgi:hypothetical protein